MKAALYNMKTTLDFTKEDAIVDCEDQIWTESTTLKVEKKDAVHLHAGRRVRPSADDAGSCCGGGPNTADQRVKSISDTTGSGVEHTTEQLQMTCCSHSSDGSCGDVECHGT